MKKTVSDHNMTLRSVAVLVAFLVAAGFLVNRLWVIQVEQGQEWRARATAQQARNAEIPAERGTIYDANMNVLATSISTYHLEAAPNLIPRSKLTNTEETDAARLISRELAELLNLDEEKLYTNLSNPDKMYYRIKANLDLGQHDAVEAILENYGVTGIYFETARKRHYPYNELASTVLGFTNADLQGIEGLEFSYNDTLAGVNGRQHVVTDAHGRETYAAEGAIYPAINGGSLVLTIDAEIQASVEKYMAEAVEYHDVSNRGMCIVMDVNTGAILAMATTSAYDPNDPYFILDDATREGIAAIPDDEERSQAQADARYLQWRNKALVDTYEPGSVFKVVTAAAALDSGAFNANSTFNCSSQITVADRDFRCAMQAAHGTIDIKQALVDSCNVAHINMAHGMGREVWYNYLSAFGLTEPTGVDLPGEPSENSMRYLVYDQEQMGPVELASCSFGQSNKFTALQMITAFSATVNGGYLMQPYIVSAVVDESGNQLETFEPLVKRQVISNETSAYICDALEELVSGTALGRNAYVAGYHVGGKSGTSEKIEKMNNEGLEDLYISSFCGVAPANDPQIAVLCVFDESSDPHAPSTRTWFGGRIAGPAAGSIISDCMNILNVEPDYEGEEAVTRVNIAAPNMTGTTVADASLKLREAGLNAFVVGDGDTVAAQYPRANENAPLGGLVVLYTEDTEPQIVAVPDVQGLSATATIKQLQEIGINTFTTGAPNAGELVKVQVQDIPPGTEVPLGTTITLTMYDTTNVAD